MSLGKDRTLARARRLMKQRVSSDHLPPTTAAKTTSLARLSVPESSGHVLSLRRRAGGTLASALRRPRLDTGDLGSAQVTLSCRSGIQSTSWNCRLAVTEHQLLDENTAVCFEKIQIIANGPSCVSKNPSGFFTLWFSVTLI